MTTTFRSFFCTARAVAGAFLVAGSVALGGLWGPTPVRAQQANTAVPDRFEVTIGVLAFRGNDRAVKRWTPTAAYLGGVIPEYDFRIVPLSLPAMQRAAQDGSIDFVLTNSGNYVMLESGYGVSRIATLRSPSGVDVGHVFGAVIITRANHPTIEELEDLKGKSFIAVNKHGFGGFQMAWRELIANDIHPFDDFKSIEFAGFPQDAVVYAVANGLVDAGTMRTGTLENMAAEGKISMDDFKVLNGQVQPGFPYELSTRLYPEWPFARMPDTPEGMTQQVAIALMAMPRDHPAAKAGRYGGWTVPSDYKPVYDLFHDLRIGPYADLGKITLKDLLARHWEWFIFAFVLVIILGAWATHTESVVLERTRDLTNANKELERQIAERRRAEEESRRRDVEIAHVWRFSTMGEMATNLAHELNQPLSAISNYARGASRRLKGGRTDTAPLLDAMDAISTQAERAGEILRRVRRFLRKDEPMRAPMDIARAVKEVSELLAHEVHAHDTYVDMAFDSPLPRVDGDTVQLQQVVLNLMRNAMEAMSSLPPDTRVLQVRGTHQKEGWVEITVTDVGPGIPDAELSHVFDPFYTTKTNGLGMGLSISRSIIESHGGRLSVSRTNEGGTEFRIILPSIGEDASNVA